MKRYLQRLWGKAEKKNFANIFSLLEKDSEATFLDCGCSSGEFTLKAASKIETQHIFGIEIVDDLIKQAEQKGIIVKKADLNYRFPFDNANIDVILAN